MLLAKDGELCFSCHEKTKEAKKSKNAHMPFNADMCTSCHNPHGSNFQNMLKDRMDTVCYSCHSDAELKFARNYTHQPVTNAQCNACHNPHGSDIPKILKASGSDLCKQCHGDLMKAEVGGTNHLPFTGGECLTCHDPHGSNIGGMIVKKQDAICFTCHPALRESDQGRHKQACSGNERRVYEVPQSAQVETEKPSSGEEPGPLPDLPQGNEGEDGEGKRAFSGRRELSDVPYAPFLGPAYPCSSSRSRICAATVTILPVLRS